MNVLRKQDPPALVIEHKWTSDQYREDVEAGLVVGWTYTPVPPPGGGWMICDRSKDRSTCWRRIRISGGAR